MPKNEAPNTESTENEQPAEGGENGGDSQTPGEQGDRTFTQDDVDRIVERRLAKERKKYEGFEDLQQQAQELQQIRDAEKSEVEKLQEQLQETNKSAEQQRLDLAKYKALAQHPVPEDYVDLVTGHDEESFLSSAERISKLASKAQEQENRRPAQGLEKQIQQGSASLDEQIADAQSSGDWALARRLKAQKLGASK